MVNTQQSLKQSLYFIRALIDLGIAEDFGDIIEHDVFFGSQATYHRDGSTSFNITYKDKSYHLKHAETIQHGKLVHNYQLI